MCFRLNLIKTIFVIFIINIFQLVTTTQRDLRCSLNPGLNSTEFVSPSFNVLHIVANNSEDTLHLLWSTFNLPSIIVARTSNNAELHIDFEKLEKFDQGAISFSEEPLESMGLTFTELWEFYDKDDKADVSKSSEVLPVNIELLQWTDMKYPASLQCSPSSAKAFLQSSNDEDHRFSQNGTVNVQFSTFGYEVPASEFPHLMFTGNSTQVQLLLSSLLPNVTRPRYAVEMKAFSSQSSAGAEDWESITKKSINDEYSPGVFKTITVAPKCDQSECESFLMWRPVCYTGPKPIIANSSEAKMSGFTKAVATSHSIADVYFYTVSNASVIQFNITFGTTNDGFYSKTRYLSWTLMAGTGQEVVRGLSLAAILLITCCLGSLLIFILGGGIFIMCQRWKKKDDDLLLSDSSIN